MPKNIVILSDGTGQSDTTTPSNILRLYQFVLKHDSKQVAIYNPGIATAPLPIGLNPVRGIRYILELGFGVGLMEDVTILYRFLMAQYQPGDSIFFFGFSRGAFTVRALAALVHMFGLLKPQDGHLLPHALELFQTSESRISKAMQGKRDDTESIDHAQYDQKSIDFKSTFSQTCEIKFMGVWDTVKAYGFVWPISFPCLRHNPSVLCVRHAMAINEQRSPFQITSWGDKDDDTERVREVWFRGDHSDVGGGHVKGNSNLTNITLNWMLGEATKHDLRLDESKCEEVSKLKSLETPLPPANNLNVGWQRFCSAIPRFELDNKHYPPARPFRFHPSGVRAPLIDPEHPYVRYHVTAVKVAEESSLDINWHDSNP